MNFKNEDTIQKFENMKNRTEEYINQNVQLIIFLTMLLLAVIFTFIGCIKLIKEDK